jgi:hypothetical protein
VAAGVVAAHPRLAVEASVAVAHRLQSAVAVSVEAAVASISAERPVRDMAAATDMAAADIITTITAADFSPARSLAPLSVEPWLRRVTATTAVPTTTMMTAMSMTAR